MAETVHEKNLREFKDRLIRGALDKLDEKRLINFIRRYPNLNWTKEQLIKNCLDNDMLCAKMAKDAMRQNLDEMRVIKKIGGEKLPGSGKNNIRFRISDGELVKGQKADNIRRTYTKSADFILEYKGLVIYGAQKSIHGGGGAQDNQVRDAVEFVQAGNKKHRVIAVIDGLDCVFDVPGVYSSDDLLKKLEQNADLV